MATMRDLYLQRVLAPIEKPSLGVTQAPDKINALTQALQGVNIDDKKDFLGNIQGILSNVAKPLQEASLQKRAYEQSPEGIAERIRNEQDPQMQMELRKDLQQAQGRRSLAQQAYQDRLAKQTETLGELSKQEAERQRQLEQDSLVREGIMKDINIANAQMAKEERMQGREIGERQRAEREGQAQEFFNQQMKSGMSPEQAYRQRQAFQEGYSPQATKKKYFDLFGKTELKEPTREQQKMAYLQRQQQMANR